MEELEELQDECKELKEKAEVVKEEVKEIQNLKSSLIITMGTPNLAEFLKSG